MVITPELIGYSLLQRPFKEWFLYMFKVVENQKFIVDKIHPDLFQFFQEIIDGKKNRAVLNLPPRSAKTTISKYFLIYGITKNPKSNFIYTSYSQSLLNQIAMEIQNILENPIYKAMYPNKIRFDTEETQPIDDFWLDYLKNETGKNTYSNKKIVTYAGGVCIFNSMGSALTGHGFSVRTAKNFSGALIIDDPQKMADIHSKTLKKKCLLYFEETLLSRANNSQAPIVCVQQRGAVDDLSGYLIEKYNFYVLKKPLLDENGECQIETQYTQERIEELKKNNYMFQSQYQQQPFTPDGEVIKRSWFNYYDINFKYVYKKIVIASDTAMSTKESADRSCFMVGGITQNNQLHIIDFVCGRWDYPTLKQKVIELWNKWQLDKRSTSASALYVEEKASGIQILQELKKTGIPILPLKADKDKYTRVQGVLEYIASGQVFLPHNEQYGFNPEILNEVESFTRDNSHLHDDITDTLVYLINVTIARKQVSLLEVL